MGGLLGAAVFACFCSAFSLNWSLPGAFSGNPLRGALSVCNSMADRLGETDYIIWRRFAGGYLADGTPAPQGMFLTVLLVLLMILCWLILRSRYRLLLLIPAVPAAALMLLTGAAPGPWAGLALAFALACALAAMSGGVGRPWIMGLPLLAALLTLGIGLALDQGNGIAMSGMQKTAVEKVRDRAEARFGENPLGSGRLDTLEGEKLKASRGSMAEPAEGLAAGNGTRTALEVTMEEPRPEYLRGFVGEVYGGGRWSALDNGEYYRQRDQLYWLNREGFDGLSQLSEALSASEGTFGAAPAGEAGGKKAAKAEGETDRDGADSGMEVRVKKADRSRIYIPYEATGTDRAIPKGTQNYAGGFLKTDRLLGSGDYAWTTKPGLTDRWTDLAGRLYSAEESDALTAYFENESRYNVWCYEKYTAVPDDMRPLLEAAVGDPGDLSRSHAGYKETIALIREYLDGHFIYTEEFSRPKDGEDAVERFLLTGKGCDAHYASLAALLFRWYGIPARYVEGYLITPGDAEGAKASRAMDIGMSHAHAWTEIYIDGLGWVPLEVTSVYRDIMPEADMEKGLEAVSYENRPKKQKESAENETLIQSESPAYGRSILRLLIGIAGLLLLLLLLWILRGLVRKRLLIRRRRKAFADPDPRKGICAMYGYLLEENIPCSAEATALGNYAAFSNHDVEELQRSQMRREMEWGEHEKELVEKINRRSAGDLLFDLWRGLRKR